jgi:hypothetical protein
LGRKLKIKQERKLEKALKITIKRALKSQPASFKNPVKKALKFQSETSRIPINIPASLLVFEKGSLKS